MGPWKPFFWSVLDNLVDACQQQPLVVHSLCSAVRLIGTFFLRFNFQVVWILTKFSAVCKLIRCFWTDEIRKYGEDIFRISRPWRESSVALICTSFLPKQFSCVFEAVSNTSKLLFNTMSNCKVTSLWHEAESSLFSSVIGSQKHLFSLALCIGIIFSHTVPSRQFFFFRARCKRNPAFFAKENAEKNKMHVLWFSPILLCCGKLALGAKQNVPQRPEISSLKKYAPTKDQRFKLMSVHVCFDICFLFSLQPKEQLAIHMACARNNGALISVQMLLKASNKEARLTMDKVFLIPFLLLFVYLMLTAEECNELVQLGFGHHDWNYPRLFVTKAGFPTIGADIETCFLVSQDGSIPLFLAAEAGNTAICRELLQVYEEHQINVHKYVSEYMRRLLQRAIRIKDVVRISRLCNFAVCTWWLLVAALWTLIRLFSSFL